MNSPPGGSKRDRAVRAAQVIVVSSVMFSFISFWRTAAVVLCDLASTAYYIGGIVEGSIGAAAPWFILGVMLFSYVVRSVYIESCTLFVRGGVYRIVREALGGMAARVAVSALMFDYILTGPISGVSAGQYIIGLVLDILHRTLPQLAINDSTWKELGSVVIASLVTLYFHRQNLLGMHESSDKAVKIMIATTIMAVIIAIWCGLTLLINGPANGVPLAPDLAEVKTTVIDPETKLPVEKVVKENPLGFLKNTAIGDELGNAGKPEGKPWWSWIGVIGIFIAFGHSILAMSGEETLAQVYREVESPKLPNFKKAAFVVFVYSLILTAGISFLAVLIIPDQQRVGQYQENLISGLAMNVVGPSWAGQYPQLVLQAFVVIVGFLILSGAVNTAIIGSNGVLNRVAEDGVLPDWFLKPHPKYGTTNRLLWLIVIMQLVTIMVSRGKVDLLGEAYAFGVVWSFVFMTGAMLVLRFKRPGHREFKVPLNVRLGGIEWPIGLGLVFAVLLISAIMNLLTKDVATKAGLAFSGSFLATFTITEWLHRRRSQGKTHEHIEQFNRQTAAEVSLANLGVDKRYRKLVAIRSPQNLFMLEKALAETDPTTTAVIVMTAKVEPVGEPLDQPTDLDTYDQQLMTAVVERAEKAGKHVTPLIVPTNNPLYALLKTAKELQAQELIIGYSNKYTAEEQLDSLSLYWLNLHGGDMVPLTVRILSRDRDVLLDLAGGNRIPKISERQARTVAELRGAGVGVNRVLMVHDGSQSSSDLFASILTMLDAQVTLDLVAIGAKSANLTTGENGGAIHAQDPISHDQEIAKQVGREIHVLPLEGNPAESLVKLAREGQYDVLIIGMPPESVEESGWITTEATVYVRRNAHCPVCLVNPPLIPTVVES